MNTDTKLYLALKALAAEYKAGADSGDWGCWAAEKQKEYQQAMDAMSEFEMCLGPIPEWAVAHNITDELVPGLQLFTKDGRNIGNAHIIKVEETPNDAHYTHLYYLLTDAGSEVRFSLREVHDWFYPGKFISKPEDVVKRFGQTQNYMEG